MARVRESEAPFFQEELERLIETFKPDKDPALMAGQAHALISRFYGDSNFVVTVKYQGTSGSFYFNDPRVSDWVAKAMGVNAKRIW